MDVKRRGRGGILNGKLRWSLYRATAANKLPPSSTTVHHHHHLPYAAKVKPNHPTADHGGNYLKMLNQQPDNLRSSGRSQQQSYNNIIVNQDQVTPQLPTHTRSVSYYPPAGDITNNTAVDSYAALYGGTAVDEAVDLKAADYISSVRERFRLDYLN